MPSIFDFLAVVLAAGAASDGWNKGSLFAEKRAKIQAEQDVTDPETWKGRRLELATCPFCQSYHWPFWLLVLLLLGSAVGGALDSVTHLVVYSLAATRMVHIIDSFLPPRMRHSPVQESNNIGPAA